MVPVKPVADAVVEVAAVGALAVLGVHGQADPVLVGSIAGVAGYSRKVRGAGSGGGGA